MGWHTRGISQFITLNSSSKQRRQIFKMQAVEQKQAEERLKNGMGG